MWSNERKNVFDNSYKVTIRCKLLDKMLGTRPNNDEIYREFIASKAPDAPSMTQEIEAKGLNNVQDKAITVFPFGVFWKTPDDVFYDFNDIHLPNVGDTVKTKYTGISVKCVKADEGSEEETQLIPFYTGTEMMVPGEYVVTPFMWDYQWRGSFKESISMLQRASKSAGSSKTEAAPKKGRKKKSETEGAEAVQSEEVTTAPTKAAGTKFKCSDIKAYKKVVDGNWFIIQRRIPMLVPDVWYDDMGVAHDTYYTDKDGKKRLNLFERSLRVETMQGPRVALSSSEFVPAGTELYFTVQLMNPADKYALFETMDFKLKHGMLQWRSGGMGIMAWTPADENGKPIDVDLEDL